ncbi:MAG: DUF4835 family protein, partial [Oxalobacteraceae bacterium]
GLDNLGKQDQASGKKIIADAIMQLKTYENNFQMNYPVNVFIDSKNKKITSAYRDGCCHHHEETYAYRAGSRVLIHAWDQVLTVDGWLETSVGQLIGKKMRYKITRVKQKIQ